jgi:DNA-3-methyladenine glycosylase I
MGEVPAETPESTAMSKDLKRRGFAFVGPTVCYAFMQAAGLVNDHVVDCFRYRAVARAHRRSSR